MTDAVGRVGTVAYDALSRPTQSFNKAIQSGPLMQQAWTADGLRASLTDANGNLTAFAYDGFDRLSTTTYPLGSTEGLTYDADSNVLTRTTRAGATISFTYDTLNRLGSKTPPSPAPVVSYTYDLAGRMTGVSDTSAAIASVATPGSTLTYATSYAYDPLNRPTGVTFGDVPAATAPTTGVNVAFTHAYNAVNQRTSQSVSDSAWIDYPPATASTTAYTANTLNQYIAVGAVAPTYDGNGNTTSDGTNTLGYDTENRLVSASKIGMAATYTFDGRGRRKTKTVNGTTTVFVTDADNREVLEYDGSTGAILRWYAYGLGSNDVVAQVDVSGGTRLTPVPDLQGSVIGTMSNAGTLTSFAYSAYGASASAPAAFGYTGQRVDVETVSYYYRARHYSPGLGRFMQADPIGYGDGTHLYAYVGNDPLNLFDPLGLDKEQGSWWNRAVNWAGVAAGRALEIQRAQTAAEIEFAGGYGNYVALQFAPFAAVAGMAVPALGASAAVEGTGAAVELGVLSGRAQEFRNLLDPIAQTRRTVAALATDGETIIAGGARDLAPAQRAAIQSGEIAARLPGEHAEITALRAAEEAGLTPRLLSTTRTICPSCAAYIESIGGKLTSSTSATFPPR